MTAQWSYLATTGDSDGWMHTPYDFKSHTWYDKPSTVCAVRRLFYFIIIFSLQKKKTCMEKNYKKNLIFFFNFFYFFFKMSFCFHFLLRKESISYIKNI